MRIPSKQECFLLMATMEMMDHIAAHSLMVCRVALLLTDHMAERGIALNRDLVGTASMLHDITKTRSFTTGENHALTGDQFLCERGFPEVGNIVGQHVWLDDYSDFTTPAEVEIVNYADKRVLHDQVVSLEERMAYILQQYGKNPELARKLYWLWEKTRILENRLFDYLPFPPDELSRFINPKKFEADLSEYRRMCHPNNPW